MNIQQALDAMDPVDREEVETGKGRASGLKKLFVAPAPSELPDDGVLNYAAVARIYDVEKLPDHSVALFSEKEIPILKVLAQHAEIFEVELAYLIGLPTAEYGVAFEQAVWNLERVAYAPLVSEINMALEVDRQAAAAKRTVHDVEREQYTRSNGTVKEQSQFTVAASEADIGGEEEE